MGGTTGVTTLLERGEPLAMLRDVLDASRTSGQLVTVCGEAGIGKSSLLRAFADRESSGAGVLWGYCEALGTPRPLGPLLDIAGSLEGRTGDTLASGSPRHEVFAAVVEDLTRRTSPVVIVFEDVHWADAATFDLLQYLGRRIRPARAMVVVTWRDDEVSADHAIHRVVGEWPHASVHRLRLLPLSLAAVQTLADGGQDARAVYALTGGNPFFVAEVLSGDGDAVPASVREAVLARRARLAPSARAVIDLVSVIPFRAERSLVAVASGAEVADLEACVNAGLLHSDAQTVSFRHELARLAVADALSSPRVFDCHQRVLDALMARPDRTQVLARIVHHAEACGAVDVLLECAPAAARQAASLGAHCQAVDHYRRALRHAGNLPAETRAVLNEAAAYEHYLTEDIDAARAACREALALYQRLGMPTAVGRSVRWLSRLAWFAGDGEEARRLADEAIEVLATQTGSEELAMAFSTRSQLDMLSNDAASCIAWGNRAIDLARTLDAQDVLAHALNNVGIARLQQGEPEGQAQLEESLQIALERDFHEHAARAYTNLATCSVERRLYAEASRWLEPGIRYCAERDLESWSTYLLAWRGRLFVETGAWERACDDARRVLNSRQISTVSRIVALAVLGVVQVRRGHADAERTLDEALSLARRTAEPQRLVPVLLARAERAWLTGRCTDVKAAIDEGLAALGQDCRPYDRLGLLEVPGSGRCGPLDSRRRVTTVRGRD